MPQSDYRFILKGLEEVEKECKDLDISFHLLLGHAKDVLPPFVKENKIGGVVTDFSPLRVPAEWVSDVTKALPKDVPFCQVDAHNLGIWHQKGDARKRTGTEHR
ncbi:deoxyribodipyrimidine photo-lyase-like [Saccostrea cucullata]|uniref:deoxyribodipyrimidine photo-lyase-like n=1 Tax=Saccostrea cuccullata TaxID=36930 RepID=UPI002ED1579E